MPEQQHNIYGDCKLDKYRLRLTWFGLAVVEELWESGDGTKHWKKIRYPVVFQITALARKA